MEELYGWIRNLTGFFLFMSVTENLLHGKAYTKYIRLFSGMVLILLVLRPLAGDLRLEERIARYYESFVFQYETDDLKENLLGIERQRLSQMIAGYEDAVKQDVVQMAQDMGFSAKDCRVVIEQEEGTERFGTVTQIFLSVSDQEEISDEESQEVLVEPVKPVEIGVSDYAMDAEDISGSLPKRVFLEPSAQAVKLRRRIASYYNLEEEYVEIQVFEGQR